MWDVGHFYITDGYGEEISWEKTITFTAFTTNEPEKIFQISY